MAIIATDLGVAYLAVAASTRGLGKDIERQVSGAGVGAGRKLGGGLMGSFKASIMPMAGMVAAVGLASLGASAVRVGVQTAAAMEKAQISFTTMLGSATKADAFIKKMVDFAAKTPFEMAGLQQSASQMIAAGISADKVIPIMTTLGNVTSGMGTGSEGISRAVVALQQMSAAGKITGEDLNQLRDAGIPVYDLLAAATGKSKAEVVKLAQAGKLGKKELDAMMKALETGKGLERFAGLMSKQSASLEGMWSTLKDTFAQGMAGIIKPLMPAMNAAMGGLTTSLKPFLDGIAASMTATVPKVEKFFKAMSAPSGGLGIVAMLSPFGLALRSILPILPQIGASLSQVAAAFGTSLAPVLAQMAPVLQQVVTALAFGMQQAILALLPALVQIATAVLPVFASVLATLVPVVLQLVQALLPIVGVVMQLVSSLLPPLSAIVVALMPVFAALGTAVAEVAQAFLPLMPIVTELASFLGGILVEQVKVAAVGIAVMVPALVGLIRWMASGLAGAIKFAAGAIAAISGFAKSVGAKMAEVGAWFGKLKDMILKGDLAGASGWLVSTGVNLLKGLWQGVSNTVDWLKGQIGNAMKGVIDQVKKDFGIASPSKVFARIGGQLTAGLAQGVTATTSRAVSALSKMASLVTSAANKAVGKNAKKQAKAAAAAVTAILKAQENAAKNGTIANLAAKREALADRIKDANAVLAEQIQSRDQLKSQVSSGIQGEFDVAAAAKRGGAAGIAAAVSSLVAKAKAFAGKLKALIQAGYPAGLVQEIAGLGTAGIRAADALLSATGAQRGSIISDYGALTSWSDKAGSYVADQMFGVGIAAQQGIIAGLLAQDSELAGAAKTLVDKITNEVRKKLGIASKSASAAAGKAVASQTRTSQAAAFTAAGSASDKPITMDGKIIGWLKTMASGQAKIVLADASLNAQVLMA